ncbi:alkaline phosphatase D family protein [Fontimonas sp. SYSU GA230001]|uniref:alkaline phosphatase D family protein n=1 Tax=Fontimonas sp. SYSU GA230001 TaxID=3142450 RepID=UPI0032B3D1E7
MGISRTPRQRRRGLSRRDFLKHASASAAVVTLAACSSSEPGGGTIAPESPFRHGVASGDPLADRVILWTRLTVPAQTSAANGRVKMYLDPALTQLQGAMDFTTSAARDWTVKLDFGGLTAGTTYYYRFEALGHLSPIGRTRTAPSGTVDRLRFGVVSCSSYAHGYFNAYRLLAQRADLDAILHLGDYVYEYGTGEYGDVRPYQPDHEMVTLADYRARHAYYKQDPDLMELHRQFPFITIWDDHETADNSWRDGANNHTEGAEGRWVDRKARGQQAYDEWMPIRYPQAGNVGRIWRRFSYGNLADLFMLDTRLYDRDEPDGIPVSATGKQADRRMLGPEQMQWLKDGLAASTAQWKIVGQQVVMHQWNLAGAPLALGGGQQLNGDAWDGYQAERAELFAHLADRGIDNLVVLSGDVHSSWCADLTPDPANPLAYNPLTGAGSVGVEFVATSITSPFAIDIPEGQQAMLLTNPHIRYTDWDRKGYLLLDFDANRAQGEYWYVSTFTEPGATESFATAYQALSGENHLEFAAVGTASAPKPDPAPLAP